MKAIVIEPYDTDRIAFQCVIKCKGHKCDIAKDYDEAIKKLVENKYNFALVNPRLEKISDLLKKLKELNLFTILTSPCDLTYFKGIKEDSFDEYLQKPFDKQKFYEVIQSIQDSE